MITGCESSLLQVAVGIQKGVLRDNEDLPAELQGAFDLLEAGQDTCGNDLREMQKRIKADHRQQMHAEKAKAKVTQFALDGMRHACAIFS